MIKKGDKVRVVFDGGDVETGYVRNKFTGKDNIEYLELDNGRAYTPDEVTKVPNQPVSESNTHLDPHKPPYVFRKVPSSIEIDREAVEPYDRDKDDRDEQYILNKTDDEPVFSGVIEITLDEYKELAKERDILDQVRALIGK